ncbi:MAG: tetratricopeptide repeat protein, partial [Acidobacteria bacterium]|nr:tetratricopeptide repeat protein [Acidobacteriota bacterium]
APALARVQAALDQAPDDARVLVVAGRAYAAAGDAARAEQVLRRAIEQDPGSMTAYDELGRVLVRQNKLDAARQEYEALGRSRPTEIGPQLMVARIHHAQGRLDDARRYYEAALALDSRNPLANNNLAFMLAEQGQDLDQALTMAQTAKAAAPEDPDVNDTLGWIYYKRNLAGLAVDPLRQAVAADPSNAVYSYHLGVAQSESGDQAGARASLQRALTLDPSFEQAEEARQRLASLR